MNNLFWRCRIWIGQDALFRSIKNSSPNFTATHWKYKELTQIRDHYLGSFKNKDLIYFYEIEALP